MSAFGIIVMETESHALRPFNFAPFDGRQDRQAQDGELAITAVLLP